MTDMRDIVGRNIREQREARGWTQERLAEAASMSREHLAVLETGRRWSSSEMAEKIATALGIPTARLYFSPDGLTDEMVVSAVLTRFGFEPVIPRRRNHWPARLTKVKNFPLNSRRF